ncbi:MAG TPA: hypothetical protein VI320_13260 [Terracidiphilus sp.]
MKLVMLALVCLIAGDTTVCHADSMAVAHLACGPQAIIPTGAVPTGAVPTGAVPTGAVPTGAVPTGAVPTGAVPTGTVPTGSAPVALAEPQNVTGYSLSSPDVQYGQTSGVAIGSSTIQTGYVDVELANNLQAFLDELSLEAVIPFCAVVDAGTPTVEIDLHKVSLVSVQLVDRAASGNPDQETTPVIRLKFQFESFAVRTFDKLPAVSGTGD